MLPSGDVCNKVLQAMGLGREQFAIGKNKVRIPGNITSITTRSLPIILVRCRLVRIEHALKCTKNDYSYFVVICFVNIEKSVYVFALTSFGFNIIKRQNRNIFCQTCSFNSEQFSFFVHDSLHVLGISLTHVK